MWASVSEPGPVAPALTGTVETDVVVIGAGFSGLSTALHLAAARKDVVVIEAHEPGWGASGRNNGQVIPTLTRPDPDDIIARHGDAGRRLVGVIRDSAQSLFELVRQHDLAAEACQTGWIQPVHTPGRIRIAERRIDQWRRHGATVESLDSATVQALTGSPIWHGGWTNPTGGHVNPLALARTMAHAVIQHDGQLFNHTPALSIERVGAQWRVSTPNDR